MTFALAYPLSLCAAWVVAWLVNLQVRSAFGFGSDADTIFWMSAKLLIWVLPTIVFVKRMRHGSIADYFALREPGKGIGFGFLIGLAVLAVSFALDFLFGGAAFGLPLMDLTLVSAALVSPFAEEWALRGFYLPELVERGIPQSKANNYAALAFAAMHLPGWYFQGRLREPLGVIQPIVFLWLFGLLLAWSKTAGQTQKHGSLYAPMIVHALNNLYVAGRG
ncbi:MAG: CPBP family intramembrane glutamic endopeptidase [Bryobacteraceae bacterium]